jgi:hypothetical protein
MTGTRTPTRTTTASRTASATRTPTRTPTITPTFQTNGPNITFFGIASGDGRLTTPVATDGQGVPIYVRPVPQGFLIVAEARPGPSNLDVGETTFNWNASDPNRLPHFQIASSQALGNGSAAVCDIMPPTFLGGVPAIDPPVFGGSQFIANAVNDFACRFSSRKLNSEACTKNQFGETQIVTQASRVVQFCSTVAVGQEVKFPLGDTRLTVRALDIVGQPGQPASIIVRVTGN